MENKIFIMLNSEIKIIKKIVLKLSIILVITLVFLFSINYYLKIKTSLPFYTPTFEDKNFQNFLSNKNVVDTLIFGDSHPGEDLDENLLPNNFLKVTQPGEDISLTLIKVRFFISKSKDIKYLVLPFDYHSLSGSYGVSKSDFFIYENFFLYKIFSINKLLDDFNRKILIKKILSKINRLIITPITDMKNTPISSQKNDYKTRIQKRISSMVHNPVIDSITEKYLKSLINGKLK